MALVLVLALTVSLPFAPAAAAAAVAPADELAPTCTGYVGVRCADGGEFCWVYVRRHLCVST